MDKLERIFQLQERFDRELAELRNLTAIGPEEWIQKEVLAIVAELSELLEEVNYKWWKTPHQVDREAIKEELVDILHFYISMCIKMNIDAEELFEGYLKKNQENFLRQQGKSLKQGYKAPGETNEGD